MNKFMVKEMTEKIKVGYLNRMWVILKSKYNEGIKIKIKIVVFTF